MGKLAELYPQYYRDISEFDDADVYFICELFGVNDASGCTHHSIKKLLLPGVRTGGKTRYDDIKEARDTLTRKLELIEMFERAKKDKPPFKIQGHTAYINDALIATGPISAEMNEAFKETYAREMAERKHAKATHPASDLVKCTPEMIEKATQRKEAIPNEFRNFCQPPRTPLVTPSAKEDDKVVSIWVSKDMAFLTLCQELNIRPHVMRQYRQAWDDMPLYSVVTKGHYRTNPIPPEAFNA